MVNDVTYELIRIVKGIELDNNLLGNRIDLESGYEIATYRGKNYTIKWVNNNIEKIIKEMVETDNQFRFKKSIFERQYEMTVEYTKCGEVVIKPVSGYGLVTIMDVDEFLEVLSFRIYKGIEKAREEHKNWKLWKLNRAKLENMGITY